MLDTTDPDRPKAMLTKDERQGLINDWSGMSRQERSYHQREIVKRVRNSILDFSLLYEKLPENRRREISDVGENPTTDEMNDFHEGLVDTIAFLYRLCKDKRGSGEGGYQYRPATFHQLLEAGISKAETDRQPESEEKPIIDVTFDVDVHEPTDAQIENVIDRMAHQSAATLSGPEARALLHAIDPHSNLYGDGTKALERLQKEREEHREAWDRLMDTGELPDRDTENVGK